MKEVWKAIKVQGVKDGYEVSNHGLVRSYIKRGYIPGYCQTPRLISAGENSDGYLRVILRGSDGGNRWMLVSRLVLMMFVGPPPKNKQCRHLNGKKLDNRVSNLKWGTAKRNADDRVLHGTAPIGERHPRARLTEKDVRFIRASKDSTKALAAHYKMSIFAVRAARLGITWQHVK